jgi:crotonobetainyl-CoA:carnitine CoA-transferase CaiB-like acyl-CoA transferase
MNVRYADSTFGASAAFGALVALLHRRRTGVGQFVDVSATESMSSMIGDSIMDYTLNGAVRECDGNRHAEMAPHGAYPCGDGEWIVVAVASDEQWRALARIIDSASLADDPRFASLRERKANEEQLDELIARWTRGSDAAALVEALQRAGIAAERSLNSLELVADPTLWARGFYTQVADRAQQSKTIPGPAWKMTRPAQVSDAAPRLGEHNAYVLGTLLGLSDDEQQALAAAGITR